jgi:hypothetical protein
VRGAAVGASFVALGCYPDFRPTVAVLTWLVWPPAMLVAWALATEAPATADEGRSQPSAAGRRARTAVAAIIAAVMVASFAYRMMFDQGLDQTAALFIGIPAILAIVVTLAVSPRSATGVACKAVTVGLLVSLVFLGEGMGCVAMSAPLFYAVAVVIAKLHDFDRGRGVNVSFLAMLTFIPMSLEGVTDMTSLNRDEEVIETRIVQAPSQHVERALFELPRFDRPLPFYLSVGFPRPTSTRIDRDAGKLRWVIRMRGGEMRLDGMEPRAGDLVLELDDARPGWMRWHAVSDDSHMTHFLAWRDMSVEWEPVGETATRVTWTLRYRRDLDPAWYFGPWERYAVRLAAGYLIESVATP